MFILGIAGVNITKIFIIIALILINVLFLGKRNFKDDNRVLMVITDVWFSVLGIYALIFEHVHINPKLIEITWLIGAIVLFVVGYVRKKHK